MALYRFLFAPVLLAVAVLQGGAAGSHQGVETRADTGVQRLEVTPVRPVQPVPAAARAEAAAARRAEPLRSPASR